MPCDVNPFDADADRHAIWEMLVRKDVDGFVAQDWAVFAPSFKFDGFCGLDARGSLDPAGWEVRFPTVEAYRDAWLADAQRSASTRYAEDRRDAQICSTSAWKGKRLPRERHSMTKFPSRMAAFRH